jgi:cytochrome c oxidase cbb3-type subunit III
MNHPSSHSRDAEAPAPGATGDGGPLTSHSYDGIEEYDNPMPAWWRRTFWATFVFSLGYFVHYQLTGNGPSVEQSYEDDMRQFRELQAAQSLGATVTEEGLGRLMLDTALMRDGQSVFRARCTQCHADRGQGNIGPNLTDEYWLNGDASLLSLYEIVGKGRTLKGMPNWDQKLRPLELAQVAAYVGTLRGKNLPGRPPQGNRIATPAAEAPAAGAAVPGTAGQ